MIYTIFSKKNVDELKPRLGSDGFFYDWLYIAIILIMMAFIISGIIFEPLLNLDISAINNPFSMWSVDQDILKEIRKEYRPWVGN